MSLQVPPLLFKFINKENLSDFINEGNLFLRILDFY
ncbi:hypothetical protein NRS6116_01120 [Bacillus subtilis]|nr:hypothetical protein NRS6116_01120 [Bacillus subtilis]